MKIIKLLQDNGRMSIKRMAGIVCLTPPAVAERIKKLEEAGVILGYRAVIDPKKLGKNVKAIINIKLDPNRRNEFLALASKNKCIQECHHVTGEFSLTVIAIFDNISDLDALVGKIQQYGSTQTLIVLSSPIENRAVI